MFNNKQVNSSILQSNSSCNNTEAANLDEVYIYIMLSVFVVFDVVGITIAALLVDELRPKREPLSAKQFLKIHLAAPTKSMVNILVSFNMILLAPVILLSTLAISFASGIFAKVRQLNTWL